MKNKANNVLSMIYGDLCLHNIVNYSDDKLVRCDKQHQLQLTASQIDYTTVIRN